MRWPVSSFGGPDVHIFRAERCSTDAAEPEAQAQQASLVRYGRSGDRRPGRRAAAAGVRRPRVGGGYVGGALAQSVEGQFFSTADWQRARLEMWHADKLVRSGQPTANQWAAVQRGLDELLISPAVKRRAGIELRKHAADVDADAAVAMTARYQQRLQSLKSV